MSKESTAVLPRYLLTLSEVVWSFGKRRTLVEDLRYLKILQGKRFKKCLMFSVEHVEDVAVRWLAGEFDEMLETVRK